MQTAENAESTEPSLLPVVTACVRFGNAIPSTVSSLPAVRQLCVKHCDILTECHRATSGMNQRRFVAGHGYCLHELRPRHQWHDRQRDRRLRIAFVTWHRSTCNAALVRHHVTRVLGQRRQSLVLRRCVRCWVDWTSQSAAMRTATAATEMKASALPASRSRKKGALKTRARSDKQGTPRAATLHFRRRKARPRPKQTQKRGLQGSKAAESAIGDTVDERGQEDDEPYVVSEAIEAIEGTEVTDDEDFHSAEEYDSFCAETDTDQRTRLPPTVPAEYERLLELHKELKGILQRAQALESLAIQERARAEHWVHCHRYGRGEENAEQQQEAAMSSVHDAETEIEEALQCVESLEEMLHQAGSSAIELVVATEEQVQRHLDHALARVAAAEHTARAECTRAQRFMAAWLVGHDSTIGPRIPKQNEHK